MLHNQVHWYDMPTLRLSQKHTQECRTCWHSLQQEWAVTAQHRRAAVPPWCTGVTAGARALPSSGLRPWHGWAEGACAIHIPPWEGEFTASAEMRFQEVNVSYFSWMHINPQVERRWKYLPWVLGFFNRFTTAKGKATKNLDFLMVWEQQ